MVTEEPIKQPLKKRRYKYRYKKVRRHRRSWAGLSKWQRGMLATLGAIVLLISKRNFPRTLSSAF
jgi:hypothetical protein